MWELLTPLHGLSGLLSTKHLCLGENLGRNNYIHLKEGETGAW